ncbi:hypothetical protein DL93DRAFT_2069844 [Clavulina sp. PMI_390]|nr:hypothetical protein DL93DRAFT_2069844 [Clavulina sp. PMI_390]
MHEILWFLAGMIHVLSSPHNYIGYKNAAGFLQRRVKSKGQLNPHRIIGGHRQSLNTDREEVKLLEYLGEHFDSFFQQRGNEDSSRSRACDWRRVVGRLLGTSPHLSPFASEPP